MSPLLIFVAVVAMVGMLAQFGGRIAARNATIWWLIAGFMMLSAIVPQALRPIADALGIEFISNLVLASMIVFLLYQTMEMVGDHTAQGRKLRRLVCRTAADRFVDRGPRPEAGERPRVLVILPCYEEEAALAETLAAMAAIESEDLAIDWCVVNDGSLDRTAEILDRDAPANHTDHLANTGVAGVLLTGFEIGARLGVDHVVQCDADGQHPFERIPELVHAAREKKADLMIGSRNVGGGGLDPSTTPLRRFGGTVIGMTLKLFGLGVPVSDPTSGFRVYSRRAIAHLVRAMPDDYPEPESIAVLALDGQTIAEHPVRMKPRETGQSSISSLGAARFMVKVVSAMLGLRLRSLFR